MTRARARRTMCAAAAFAMAGALTPTAIAGAADGVTPPRTLVADQEFNGAAIDTGNWSEYNGLSSNGVSHWTPSELSEGDGELRVHSHGKDPSGADNYSGALAWDQGAGNQTYGTWLVRARFGPGAGYGPAILLWPQSNNWPADGEIDLVESMQPKRNTALASLHWGTSAPGHRESGKLYGDYTQWHVYAVDWQPTYVKISIDGQTVYDTRYSKENPAIPHTPMHLVIQQEPGPFGAPGWLVAPNSSTPDDVMVHVDWVRVYR
ncbi:MAG TPA: glycoside hydrolase family 16 protein [Pseudonocardiaceae bacterium]|nr:glycoside hydrolase family 16 protein [Pseudonocardiaceae bacterium]